MDVGARRNRIRLRRGLGAAVGVAALLASVLVAAPAHAAATLVVDDDGQQCAGAPYATIGAALDAAADGDTISVCPGVYAERVVVTKSVRLIGPVDAVRGFDCFSDVSAQPGDLDATRFAVIEPPTPTTEATEPVVALDADGIEIAGLAIQGVIDQTPAPGSLFTPAVASSETHSGYRVHDNLFRSNTLALEFGSSGVTPSKVEQNCFRENRYAVANQRLSLANAEMKSNAVFRIDVVAFEAGWAPRPAVDVTVKENDIRQVGYGVVVENAASVRVSDNRVASVAIRGIWISAGNVDVDVADNVVEGTSATGGNPAGIIVTGPAAGLPRSTGVLIRDNVVSGIRYTSPAGAVFGYGIVLGANALAGGVIADNIAFDNGQGGITLFNNNVDNVVRDNVAYDNAWYGIRVQVNLSVGNVLRDNEMWGNDLADASDTTDPNLEDGIQLLNTWRDNECVTDQPVGSICGVE